MEPIYWADKIARKIIEERGEKKEYVIASGITPSGIIHIGNLREEMTVDLVKRALISAGKKVRYIHSWDDYDRFRKVPAGIPEDFEKYIGLPVTKVPDPFGCHSSYGEHFEKEFEESSKKIGIQPEYVYENKKYRNCEYSEEIKTALENKEKIKEILNRFRKEPLSESWWPIQIYCEKCGKDNTHVTEWDGNYKIKYKCTCGFENEFDFREKGIVKLRWRVDWPMRWNFYKVDFEPGGKEHSTPGGSRTTAEIISEEVYNYKAPIYQMYDFIILKGFGGKMSGSKGNVIALPQLLEVYLPEVVRYFYASTRPDAEFSIPLKDDEVFKVYEDFYKCERIYFNSETVGDKKKDMHWKRVYEMSVVDKPPENLPVQIPFRFMAYLVQFYQEKEKIIEKLKETGHIAKIDPEDEKRIDGLIYCSKKWVENWAPEEYKFELQMEKHFEPNEEEKKAIQMLIETISQNFEENDLYKIGKESGLKGQFFKLCYKIFLKKEQGPRLYQLLHLVGIKRAKEILKKYL